MIFFTSDLTRNEGSNDTKGPPLTINKTYGENVKDF